ncbi:MAG: flavin reductase [Chloroflexi bacterium]|nr:flavin reductase [Chloroflexota bacterium]|tara:strand:+ start:262 stop:762 length:501 start_codon:yes stop_codon:yes gene_type:complete
MSEEKSVDSRSFRDTMGIFATGVTVVTLESEELYGMTANAFSSLSLDPPLILICVAKTASMHTALAGTSSFAVNILGENQEDISTLFAKHGRMEEPLSGTPYHTGVLGTPILDGCIAFAECKIRDQFPGGDHTIIVGEVVDFASNNSDDDPLLFFKGKYRKLSKEF